MRERIVFNDNWLFHGQSGEERVTLPHTWNRDDGYTEKLYLRGVFSYSKEFEYSLEENRRLYVEFEGVNSSSRVIFNGVELGNHDGGYSTFRFDLTPFLQAKNTITVTVDNTPNDRVYPQKADFTFYGGIYRNVYLVETDEIHFPLLEYGGPGVKVSTKVEGRKGILSFSSKVKGEGDRCIVAIGGSLYSFPVEKGEVKGEVTIDDVHLWDGLEDPYLYKVSFSLEKNGEEKDRVELKTGFRTIEIDSTKGFFLNGRSYPLRGVSRHQDRWGKGNAIDRMDEEEDMEIILDSGANSLRLAHYQHSQHFYELCDEKGLLVWAEIPFITVFMENGEENTLSQMRELVTQNIHHPSIYCWALSNEITLQGVTDNLIENHRRLNDLCHALDGERYTAMANLFMLETSSPLLSIPDIIGYNIYYGWYVGDLKDNENFLDSLHREHPEYRIAITEYGADAAVAIQSPCPERGDFSEGYQAMYHTYMASLIASRPWLWGTYVWNMFDFGASGRNEAGDPGKNHKGLVTFDRKTRKDAYWLYASYWRKKSFVYIAGRRYRNRVEEETEVKVYSNSSEVELSVDGRSLGRKKGSNVFTFSFKITGSHVVTAKNVEGDVDSIELEKVAAPDPSYFIPGSKVVNWFDRKESEDDEFLSINSTLGEIEATEEGRKLMEEVNRSMMEKMAGGMGKGVKVSPEMAKMALRQPLSKLLAQGGLSQDSDAVERLNATLRKIRKVRNDKI